MSSNSLVGASKWSLWDTVLVGYVVFCVVVVTLALACALFAGPVSVPFGQGELASAAFASLGATWWGWIKICISVIGVFVCGLAGYAYCDRAAALGGEVSIHPAAACSAAAVAAAILFGFLLFPIRVWLDFALFTLILAAVSSACVAAKATKSSALVMLVTASLLSSVIFVLGASLGPSSFGVPRSIATWWSTNVTAFPACIAEETVSAHHPLGWLWRSIIAAVSCLVVALGFVLGKEQAKRNPDAALLIAALSVVLIPSFLFFHPGAVILYGLFAAFVTTVVAAWTGALLNKTWRDGAGIVSALFFLGVFVWEAVF